MVLGRAGKAEPVAGLAVGCDAAMAYVRAHHRETSLHVLPDRIQTRAAFNNCAARW